MFSECFALDGNSMATRCPVCRELSFRLDHRFAGKRRDHKFFLLMASKKQWCGWKSILIDCLAVKLWPEEIKSSITNVRHTFLSHTNDRTVNEIAWIKIPRKSIKYRVNDWKQSKEMEPIHFNLFASKEHLWSPQVEPVMKWQWKNLIWITTTPYAWTRKKIYLFALKEEVFATKSQYERLYSHAKQVDYKQTAVTNSCPTFILNMCYETHKTFHALHCACFQPVPGI